MASIPAIATKLVVFDTAVLDLTEDLEDPVEVLFGVQLGGGTDINQALAYCERLVCERSKTHLILISDLYEGGNAEEMLARAQALVNSGVNVIALLALSDSGRLDITLTAHSEAEVAEGAELVETPASSIDLDDIANTGLASPSSPSAKPQKKRSKEPAGCGARRAQAYG